MARQHNCEWCEGRKVIDGVVCPKCKGTGVVGHACFSPEIDACHPAHIMRMVEDPTYRELIDGPARPRDPRELAEAVEICKRWKRSA